MKMLKRLFQVSGKSWFSKPRPVTQLCSAVEPDEFCRLLRSGRSEDLKILARKLSGPARVRI